MNILHMAVFTSRSSRSFAELRPHLCLTIEKTFSMWSAQSGDIWKWCGQILPSVSEFSEVPGVLGFPGYPLYPGAASLPVLMNSWASICHPWELDVASGLDGTLICACTKSPSTQSDTDEEFAGTELVRFIAVGLNFATILFSSFCSCILFRHLFSSVGQAQILKAATLAEITDAVQMKKNVPFVTWEVSFSQCLQICVWCRHSWFELGSNLILSNSQSRVNLWVLDTWTPAFDYHFNHCFVVLKMYHIAVDWKNFTFEGTLSTWHKSKLSYLVEMLVRFRVCLLHVVWSNTVLMKRNFCDLSKTLVGGAMFATFRVARLAPQTPKLWMSRPWRSQCLLACLIVSFFLFFSLRFFSFSFVASTKQSKKIVNGKKSNKSKIEKKGVQIEHPRRLKQIIFWEVLQETVRRFSPKKKKPGNQKVALRPFRRLSCFSFCRTAHPTYWHERVTSTETWDSPWCLFWIFWVSQQNLNIEIFLIYIVVCCSTWQFCLNSHVWWM